MFEFLFLPCSFFEQDVGMKGVFVIFPGTTRMFGRYSVCTMAVLQVDVDLARQIAGSELRNEELQKKLWLKVAQHVIRKEKDIEKYIYFL